MKDADIPLKWYEKLLIIPYFGAAIILMLGLDFIDGTHSKVEKEKDRKFEEGLRRTHELYKRYKTLSADQILTELQLIHTEARVSLAVPFSDWGMGFYEMIVKICDESNLTTARAEQLVEMAGWNEFRDYTQDNSARMKLLFTAHHVGLTKTVLPTLQSLLKFVATEEYPPGTNRAANQWSELKLLRKMVETLQAG